MDLFKGEYRFQVRKVTQSIQERVSAKAQLWDFINDTKEVLLNWEYTDNELASQLITSVISILYPHFTILEIERELRNIYNTIKKPVPTGFIPLFCNSYSDYISARLRRTK